MRNSLRLRLLLFLLLPSAVLIAVNAIFASRSARDAADTAYDRTLAASVYAIAERITVSNGRVVADIPFAALEMFESQHQDRVFYRIGTGSGETVTGYADLPAPPPGEGIRYFDTIYRGESMRFAAYDLPLYVGTPEKSATILVGETLSLRNALAKEIFLDALFRQTLLVVIGILTIWIGIRLVLQPLMKLREEVERRDESEFEPLATENVYAEVRPLVQTLNLHMARLEELIQSRQRFIANASHQLRTPLTLLNTQAEFAIRQTEPEKMREVVEGLRESTQKTVRLANQLLTISRAELDTVARTNKTRCDLHALAREATLEFTPAARKKNIDLGFEAGDEQSWIMGNVTLLHELTANLIDNAIRYTADGGTVTVAVTNRHPRVELSVTDNGPGIPPDEHENVFKRFYSILGQSSAGSGLGLAIVRDIAEGHDATVALDTGPGGHGLKATVSFPVGISASGVF